MLMDSSRKSRSKSLRGLQLARFFVKQNAKGQLANLNFDSSKRTGRYIIFYLIFNVGDVPFHARIFGRQKDNVYLTRPYSHVSRI